MRVKVDKLFSLKEPSDSSSSPDFFSDKFSSSTACNRSSLKICSAPAFTEDENWTVQTVFKVSDPQGLASYELQVLWVDTTN